MDAAKANTPTTVNVLRASESSRSWSTRSAFEGVSTLQHQLSVGTQPISVSVGRNSTAIRSESPRRWRTESRFHGSTRRPRAGSSTGLETVKTTNVAISLRRDKPCTMHVGTPMPGRDSNSSTQEVALRSGPECSPVAGQMQGLVSTERDGYFGMPWAFESPMSPSSSAEMSFERCTPFRCGTDSQASGSSSWGSFS